MPTPHDATTVSEGEPQPELVLTNDMILDAVVSELDYVTKLRRRLHMIPETAYSENETSKLIQEELRSIGVEFRAGYAGGTGIVAKIPATTGVEGSSIGLRADIDGLPITERTGKEYASTRPGFHHACGHDGHMAILVGVARCLMKLPIRPNPITLVFQPAEEGGAGAKKMVADGALESVRCMFGLHGWPHMDVGNVGSCEDAITAGTLIFDLKISGTQSHAGFPHLAVDPIVTSAHVITALQSIVSRNVPPKQTSVLSICQVHGGSAHNIIPESVELKGTVRTFRTEIQQMIMHRMERICTDVASSMGCTAELKFGEDGYPPTMNDRELVHQWFEHAEDIVGPGSVKTVEPFTGGEDFAFYSKVVPSVFFFLGVRPQGTLDMPFLHAPEFDFNDDAIAIGMKTFLKVATSTDIIT